MSYESSLKRLPNFLRYVNKVYGFSQSIEFMQDKRDDTDVSAQTIFMSVFLIHECVPLFVAAFGLYQATFR